VAIVTDCSQEVITNWRQVFCHVNSTGVIVLTYSFR